MIHQANSQTQLSWNALAEIACIDILENQIIYLAKEDTANYRCLRNYTYFNIFYCMFIEKRFINGRGGERWDTHFANISPKTSIELSASLPVPSICKYKIFEITMQVFCQSQSISLHDDSSSFEKTLTRAG
jgi:hypothetical protein